MVKEKGLGLVEVIVGLFIGLLVLLSTYASLIAFHNNERTSVTGNSALENGIAAMFRIEHDVKTAGAGILANGMLGCSTLNLYYNGQVLANNSLIAPVIITSGASGAPDKISVFYATSLIASTPTQLIQSMGSPDDNVVVNAGFNLAPVSLILLAAPGSSNPCTVMGVSQSQVSNLSLVLSTGSTPFDPASHASTFSNAVAYSLGSYAMNLGGLNWTTYQLVNNALQVKDNLANTSTPIADNIVQMHAQYGIQNSTNGIQWADATGSWASLTATTIPQIQAIRIALVARSIQREKPSVQGGTCDATTQFPIAWVGGSVMDLSADPNWRCYRYRVLRTVIPIKNVIWGLNS
jgi:type IV pilus assembly protein PilW